jgi:hypothetical protein
VNETVALVVARASKLRKTVRDATQARYAYAVIDGKLMPINRGSPWTGLLLRQAAQARDEPAGHRQPGRRHPVGVWGAAWHGGRNKPGSQKQANKAHAKLRSPGERANAQLKSWRILRKLRCCPGRADQLAKAIYVLQTREIGG